MTVSLIHSVSILLVSVSATWAHFSIVALCRRISRLEDEVAYWKEKHCDLERLVWSPEALEKARAQAYALKNAQGYVMPSSAGTQAAMTDLMRRMVGL